MKRVFSYLLFIILVFTSNSFAVNRYGCTGLIGGVAGALDALDITGAGNPNVDSLVDGDSAIVATISGTTTTVYEYIFDVDGTTAESSPSVIRPDDYATQGVWRLSHIQASSFITSKTSGVAGRVVMYEANSTDTHTAGLRGPASITGDGAYEGQLPNARPSSANIVLAFTNAGETGTGTAADPYVQATSWLDLDNYQAADADLTTWAGVTPGANVGTFLSTPTLANLFGAVTGEGTGVETAMGNAVNGASGFATYSHTAQYSATPVIDDPDNFAANFTGGNLYGGTFISNAAGTAALPDPVVGMNFTYVLEGANANVIDPLTTGTADTIVMNGLAAAQDENITSSTSGAICYFQYRAANSWMATCADFAEATP